MFLTKCITFRRTLKVILSFRVTKIRLGRCIQDENNEVYQYMGLTATLGDIRLFGKKVSWNFLSIMVLLCTVVDRHYKCLLLEYHENNSFTYRQNVFIRQTLQNVDILIKKIIRNRLCN